VDRIISNVVVAPSGSLIRLDERMLYITFLDKDFRLIKAASDTYKDPSKETTSAPGSANLEKAQANKILTKASPLPL